MPQSEREPLSSLYQGSNLATVVAVSLVAYAGCDMVHEALGHGTAAALSPTVRALSLSTVALQTSASNRWIAAAGSIANIIVGLGAYALFRRRIAWDGWTFFLALFAATNLLNGTGYLIFSAALDIGDWAAVFQRAEPRWLWRSLLGALGIVLYGQVTREAANGLVRLIRRRLISRHEPRRVLITAYISGGLLFVLGAAMNPISRSLILTSGVSSGFGAMAGLAIIPSIVRARVSGEPGARTPLPFSVGWCVAGTIAAVVFVAVIGPGVQF